ncbi:hypothetical protein [Micromonospora avicenniae]|uniref:Short chain dehydrogenase n=1 Tax=Micromonospora avicenniae TaxID=1198245 RepID=A0A1N7EV65_9ACTN|nr:hypothetical protein [Micromonospora avicenniae]SIR91947.1 hypothetical protein SAMN05444858_12758 [Micromonospora avicenniae]
MGQLDGRVAVVTGSSEGIGFASAPVRTSITGRRKPELDEAVAGIGATRATGVKGDVTDLADLDRLFATIGMAGRSGGTTTASAKPMHVTSMSRTVAELLPSVSTLPKPCVAGSNPAGGTRSQP